MNIAASALQFTDNHPRILLAAIIIIIVLILVYYMHYTGRLKSTLLPIGKACATEPDELDRLIENIHNKQKKDVDLSQV